MGIEKCRFHNSFCVFLSSCHASGVHSKFKIQNSLPPLRGSIVGVSLPSEHFADAVNGCDEGVDLGLGVVEREGSADGALYA